MQRLLLSRSGVSVGLGSVLATSGVIQELGLWGCDISSLFIVPDADLVFRCKRHRLRSARAVWALR
jgi:hypothetical protein